MRIRSIKPEFWRSADIVSLHAEDRLLFIGLWSYVDDNGVGKDEAPAIIGDLFAADMFHDPRETVARVSRGLSNLSDKGLITRYTVDSKPFLFVVKWESHQRIDKPAKPRYPRPEAENAILATPSRDLRDTPAPGTGEQGNRGTGEQGADSLSPDESGDQIGALIPADWRPNQTHIDKAKSLHLDIRNEYQRFRASAEQKQRRLKNWNTGFTNWLRKSAEFNQQKQGGANVPPLRQQQSKAAQNAERFRELFGDEPEGSIPALDAGIRP